MTIRHLRVFLEVARCGSMSQAAKNLYISQPTVSQAIAEIEAEYQVRLFSRLSKHLYITVSGEQLLEYAGRIIDLYNEMEQTMHSKQIVRLRLGASLTVGTSIFSQLLSAYQELHPEVETRVMVENTGELEDNLLHGKLDIALVDGQIKSPDILYEPVISDTLVFACRPDHPLSGRESVSARELDRLPMVLREERSSVRKTFESFMREQGCEVNCAWACHNTDTIKSAVAAGHGPTVISRRLIQRELDSGEMHACRIEDFPGTCTFALAYHKDKRLFLYFSDFLELCRKFGAETV